MTNAKETVCNESKQADLESRLAFQEEALSQFGDLVARQDRRIVRLEQQLQALAGRYQNLRDALDEVKGLDDGAVSDARPPHY